MTRRLTGQPDVETVHYWFGGALVATDEDGTLRFVHSDHLGSSSVATDENGGVVAGNTYYPYGEHRSSSGAFGTDRDFTGQRLDGGTGLHFYNARYYDSVLGRFISPDSIIQLPYQPSTYNRYSYVLNNPLTHIDPTGNCVFGLPCPKKAQQALDVVHIGLDVAGFIPGVGEFADLTNAAIYAAEGDFLNAAISGAGAIPGIGMAATGARLANRATDVARTADEVLPAVRGGADPVLKGQRGVNHVADELRQQGYRVQTEVTVRTEVGTARLDIVATRGDGNFMLYEVKTGPKARLTKNQLANYEAIEKYGFTPAGRNAAEIGLRPGTHYSSREVLIRHISHIDEGY